MKNTNPCKTTGTYVLPRGQTQLAEVFLALLSYGPWKKDMHVCFTFYWVFQIFFKS